MMQSTGTLSQAHHGDKADAHFRRLDIAGAEIAGAGAGAVDPAQTGGGPGRTPARAQRENAGKTGESNADAPCGDASVAARRVPVRVPADAANEVPVAGHVAG